MSAVLETVEVETGAAPTGSVLWLHGLGADGHDFEPIVPALQIDAAVRFVFPHAPIRQVTINQGIAMRAWYDILALDRTVVEDTAGIRASQTSVMALIDRECARGIAAERIVLAGFSQGGAIALHTGVRCPQTLGGIMALSAYLPLRNQLLAERSAANATTPVFMAHGRDDTVLPESLGRESMQILESHDYRVEWHSYAMGHMVCAQEVQDISSWLNARLPADA
jgi:phospholipase/carboxylesterase